MRNETHWPMAATRLVVYLFQPSMKQEQFGAFEPFFAALQTIKCLASKKRDACCCCRYRQISRDLSNVTRNAGVRPCLMRQAHRHLYTLLYLRLWLTIGRHSAAAERRSDARLTGTGNTGRRSTADGRVNKSKSAAPNESGPSKLPFC